MAKNERDNRGHILVVPFPAQGHINPMLQFSKRLVSKGLKVTVAITTFASKSMHADTVGPIKLERISDGFDENGAEQAGTIEAYLDRFKIVGSQSLYDLIKKLDTSGDPICCVVYDSFLQWALDVAKELSVVGAAFFTQSAAVNNIYYHVQRVLLPVPVETPVVSLPGLPPLEVSDLPSFVSAYGSYPSFFTMVSNQFSNIDKADWILFNTFEKLEPEVVDWMAKLWPIITIGPTVPSMYLDARVEGDNGYGLNLFEPSTDTCLNWLNSKETGSVVYVSFGSIAELSVEQMEELACGLRESNVNFLWVVRAKEKYKLPEKFLEETTEKGLVVTWCPQLEVLAHSAVGCFVTHSGWNSTLEALSLGVPMVALPQWTDQATNAKFVEDEWRMGLRARVDDQGISRRTEIEACIKEIMEGEKGKEIRKNARTWKDLSKEAVGKGGTSDKNIEEFVSKLITDT